MNKKIHPGDEGHGGKGQVKILDFQANTRTQADIVLVLPGKDPDNESDAADGPQFLQEIDGTGRFFGIPRWGLRAGCGWSEKSR